MHRYRLYGLGVHADFPLWETERASAPEDVRVHWKTGLPATGAGSGDPVSRVAPDGDVTVTWPGIARMVVRQGREIHVQTVEERDVGPARQLVTGPGMGLLCHQRGKFTLHASVVAIGGKGVAIAGPKHAGKSTTAAALSGLGHTVLGDDVLVLDMDPRRSIDVLPGPRTTNLWPDAAEALGHDPGSLPLVWSGSAKRVAIHSEERSEETVPLRHVFFIEPTTDGDPAIRPLGPTRALASLVGHSHALRIVEDPKALPRHFEQCGRLVNEVEISRLLLPRSLPMVHRVAEMISSWVRTPPLTETPRPRDRVEAAG